MLPPRGCLKCVDRDPSDTMWQTGCNAPFHNRIEDRAGIAINEVAVEHNVPPQAMPRSNAGLETADDIWNEPRAR